MLSDDIVHAVAKLIVQCATVWQTLVTPAATCGCLA